LSIDGIKKAHEIGRGQGSYQKVQDVINIIKDYPELSLSTVSVVTPKNVKYLSESVRFLVKQGVDRLRIPVQFDDRWDPDELGIFRKEYEKAYTFLILNKRKGGKTDFDEYKAPDPLKPVFQCDAGKDDYVVSPEGELYGCNMLIPWSRKAVEMNTTHHFTGLSLGHVNDLGSKIVEKRRETLLNDMRLIGQYFRHTSDTQCRNCDYIDVCGVCPATGMIYSDDPCFVPDWVCSIKKTVIDVSSKF
jgi:radical SAM protein with 4Fe4S-binding SPASM domain